MTAIEFFNTWDYGIDPPIQPKPQQEQQQDSTKKSSSRKKQIIKGLLEPADEFTSNFAVCFPTRSVTQTLFMNIAPYSYSIKTNIRIFIQSLHFKILTNMEPLNHCLFLCHMYTQGEILVNGITVDQVRDWYISNTGYVLQLATPYYEELTVRENLTLAAHMRLAKTLTLTEKFKRVEQVLNEVRPDS